MERSRRASPRRRRTRTGTRWRRWCGGCGRTASSSAPARRARYWRRRRPESYPSRTASCWRWSRKTRTATSGCPWRRWWWPTGSETGSGSRSCWCGTYASTGRRLMAS
ncbi:atofp18 ofp18 [Musa troglodytarum]|uniref:Atofp18 ofp18 n=1 Tax=Musa troglodytarum TaxID=320322 RepID=A0A9E7HVV5_9LILI|nr:atofp18 ofp18 [Musa troglodytarum]